MMPSLNASSLFFGKAFTHHEATVTSATVTPPSHVSVANCEAAPEAGLHVVSADFLQLVLDAPGHDMLVPRQEVHGPDGIVREILLDVGEAGHGFSLHEMLTIGKLGEPKDRHAVAE